MENEHMLDNDTAGIGHNSGADDDAQIAPDRLRSLVERIEQLAEERKGLNEGIRDIYTEAKSAGFDVKTLRQLVRIRNMDATDVEEQEMLLDLYRRTLGM